VRWVALFALLLCVSSAVPVFADSSPSPGIPQPPADLPEGALPDGEQVAQGMSEADKLEGEEEASRGTQLAIAEREASLLAYSDASPSESEDLLLSTFADQLTYIDQDPARMLSDAQIQTVLGSSDARVTFNGETMLLDGTIPVRTQEASGELGKVDLDLVADGEGYVPVNPLTELTLPASSAEAMTIGEEEIEIQPVLTEPGEEARSLEGEDLLYPETQTDTDLLASPISSGLELFSLLRSVESPEELRFEFTLPDDATLRSDGKGGAEVVRDDELLAEVPAPTAIDAQGADVPVQMQIEGSMLVVGVEHRSMDVTYPLLVDPAISESWYGSGSWQSGQNLAALSDGTWVFQSSDWGRFWPNTTSPIKGLVGGAERGLFVTAYSTSGNQPAGHYAQWSYTVPGATTWISTAGINPLWRFNGNCSAGAYPEPHDYVGLWSPAWSPKYGWIFYQKDAAVAYGYAIAAPPKDWREKTAQVLIIGLGTGSTNSPAIPCRRDLYAGGAYVWIDDGDQPQLTTSSTGAWMDSSPVRLNVSATDPGLGIKSFKAAATNTAGKEQEWWTSHSCTGLRAKPCPASWNLNELSQPILSYNPAVLPEGVNTLNVTAYDATQKPSTKTSNMTIRVDHAAPTIKLSGSLTEQGSLGASRPRYKLRVDASDGDATNQRSGVVGLTVKIDGKQVDSYQPGCATQSCSAWAEYTFTSSGYSFGKHVLAVQATDALGHSGTKEINFEIVKDEKAPSIGITGKLVEDAVAGPYSGAALSATDSGAGVTSLKLEIDDETISEVTQPCADGGCSMKAEVAKDLARFASGTHTAKFIAVDGAGNVGSVTEEFSLDSDGPVVDLSGSLAEAEEIESPERFLDLEVSAVDMGSLKSGVAGVQIEVDDEFVKSWTSTCSPKCPESGGYAYVYDQEAWPAEGHTVYVYAKDSLKNLSVTAVDVGYAGVRDAEEASCPEPGEAPKVAYALSPEQSLLTLEEAEPSSLASTTPMFDEAAGRDIDPSLSPTTPELSIKGTMPGGEITEDGLAVSVGEMCIAPSAESVSTSDPLLISDDAVIYANTAEDMDTVVKPTAMGATLINQLRSEDAPSSLTYKVDLAAEQKLVLLENGAVAVTEPVAEQDNGRANDKNVEESSSSTEAGLSAPENVTDEDLLTDAAAQVEQGEWHLGSAQEAVTEEIIAVIAQPWVRDAAGQEVPVYLTVAEDTFTINIWEPEEEVEEEWSYPFISNTEIVTFSVFGVPKCVAQAKRPYMRHGGYFGGPGYWHLLYGAAMRCSNVQYMKITVKLQRKKKILFVSYWDTVAGAQNEKSGEGGLGWKYGGEECVSTPDHHDFRTQIDGHAINNVNPACWKELDCKVETGDASKTGTYRCAN
jgi:hypothetical protein